MTRIFPTLALFLLFIAWTAYQLNKSKNASDKSMSDFWIKESQANQTRKVPADRLPYIHLSLTSFPIGNYSDTELQDCENTLLSLKDAPIINLTGKTATDLKAEYGVANLSHLDECDLNYTKLIKTIAAYGTRLHALGYIDDSIAVLEYGIAILSDISSNYKLLGTLYLERNEFEKFQQLKETASTLPSLMKPSILRSLEEMEDSVS